MEKNVRNARKNKGLRRNLLGLGILPTAQKRNQMETRKLKKRGGSKDLTATSNL
jgi:hypothetical protein